MTAEPILDGTDIQGNVIPGFARAKQRLVGFQSDDPAALARALAIIAETLTDLATVMAMRAQVKRALSAGQQRPISPDLWLNYSLGRRATDALGLPEARAADPAFRKGMVAAAGDSRTPTLADGSPNIGAPVNWFVGSPNAPLDLLLIFAGDDDVDGQSEPVVERIVSCGMTRTYSETGARLPEDREHFGFRDNITQPGILGQYLQGGTPTPITTRYGVPAIGGVEYGKPGQPLISPDQFLFATDTSVLRNGSFLVFRRLLQDVRWFFDYTATIAVRISAAVGHTITAEDVRARIIGRHPSGDALMRPTSSASEQNGPPDLSINYFNYVSAVPDIVLNDGRSIPGTTTDPHYLDGGRCPVWSHVRKVNPRDLLTNLGGPDQTRNSQVLRRGTPFGPVYDHTTPDNPINREERGLLFVAYQAGITYQFEVLNSAWMNSYHGPEKGGFDLLAGQAVDGSGAPVARSASYYDDATGIRVPIEAPGRWVTPTGGAYMFAPSVSWTRHAAGG